VAQHVGMGEQEQGSGGAVFPQKEIDGRAVQRLAVFGSRRTSCRSASSGRVPSSMRQSPAARRRVAAASLITRPSTGAHATRGFRCPLDRASSGRPPTRATHAGISEAPRSGPFQLSTK
jgi:hypothetical protein